MEWRRPFLGCRLVAVALLEAAQCGTDGEGHKIGAAYAVMDKVTLGFTYFDGEKCFDDIKCDSRDYDRLMIDAQFKY